MSRINRLTAITWTASAALHALVVLPFAFAAISPASRDLSEVYDAGTGQDSFKVTVEPMIEQVDLQPVTPPIPEVKPLDPDLKTVITAKESPVEMEKVVEQQPPQPPPPVVAALQPQEAPAVAYDGGKQTVDKATVLTAYVNSIHSALRNVKLGRRVTGSGKVIVGFRIGGDGKARSPEVLKSSGSPAIDKAAVDMLAKATFPPPPQGLGSEEYYKVPFAFSS